MGDLKLLHRIVKFIIYGNLCKFMRNHQKCFFSFISRPILIVIALFGRAELRTLNFYTEFWNFAPLINYGNLCKFIPKITKIASSPTFLDRFSLFILSDRARWVLQNLYTKFRNSLIMLIYANLFKITNKITKNASSPSFLNRFWFSLLYLVELSLVH